MTVSGSGGLGGISSPSSARLTSASAAAFSARGTERIDQRSNRPSASSACACSGCSSGVLDLVLAVDLLGDELGVVDDLDLGRAERRGALEPEQQAAVLGDVVRRVPERDGGLVEHLPVGRGDDSGRGGGTRVAAGAAVHVDDDLHAAGV